MNVEHADAFKCYMKVSGSILSFTVSHSPPVCGVFQVTSTDKNISEGGLLT